MQKKIIKILGSQGNVSTEENNHNLTGSQIIKIINMYDFVISKDLSIEENVAYEIPKSEIILRVKIKKGRSVFQTVPQILDAIKSPYYKTNITENFESNLAIIHLDVYAKLSKQINSSTTVQEALIIENLSDEKISIVQKISFVYQRITIKFLI